MKKSTKIIIGVAGLVCVLALVVIIVLQNVNKNLSKDEVLKLRKEYPDYAYTTSVDASMKPINNMLESELKDSETIVYGEIVGDEYTYSKKGSTGIKDIDDKKKSEGIETVFEYFGYKLKVISDTNNKFKAGDVIDICSTAAVKPSYPELSNGQKIVVPVSSYDMIDELKNEYWFYSTGLFYVTSKDYCISAYKEEQVGKEVFSGFKRKNLFSKLKNIANSK